MYDAIVVGARCAGSPTAMLLARKGYRVLLVDRAKYPSNTLSTHFIRPSRRRPTEALGSPGASRSLGLPADRQVQAGLGQVSLFGSPPPLDGVAESYAPRDARQEC